MARFGQIMGRSQQMIQLDPAFFNALENHIRWAEGVKRKLPIQMDRLCRFMAYTNLGLAQKDSLGPYDPQERNAELAWKIPVRRISGRYFFGWKVRRVGLGHWELFNDSREAFFIEFGIHQGGRKVRRPIQKDSLAKTLKFMAVTEVGHRVWTDIFFPPPGMRVGKGFEWQMTPRYTPLPEPLRRYS